MKELYTETKIQAPVELVWGVLMDVARYSEWNPFIQSLEGHLVEGATVRVKIKPADKKTMTIRPQILSVQKDRELRWKGSMLLPGIFDGEHIFELKALENETTQFIHREKFSGVLVPLFRKMLDDNTRRGFEMMNRQLRERCEAETGLR